MAALAKTFGANAAVAGRFLPIWLATGVLLLVAAIIAPKTLQNTSWAYILPYMTILAIAALGQMLVIMHAGIDLSTPGVISFGGNLIVGVSLGQDDRLALGLLACLGLGAGCRPRQRDPRRDREAEPADRHPGRRPDRRRVEPAVRAREHELAPGAAGAVVVGGGEAARHQLRLLDGRGDHPRASPSCSDTPPRAGASRRSARTREPPGWPGCASGRTWSSLTPRPGRCTRWRRSCSPGSASTSTRPSAPPTCCRRSRRS